MAAKAENKRFMKPQAINLKPFMRRGKRRKRKQTAKFPVV